MLTSMPPIARSLAGAPSPDGIHAPAPMFLTGEEQLRISSIGNAAGVTLLARGRVLRPDYDIAITEQAHTPNSDRTLATTTIALSEGWPLGFEVKASAGTPAFGAVWVLVELVRGISGNGVVVEALGCGFVTASQPWLWPGGPNVLATDGPGCLRSIAGTQPGAGAEISEVVPTGARWDLLAFEADLVTAVAAANRVPQLTLDDGTNVYSRFSVNTNETASLTWKHSFQQGVTLNADATRNVITAPLPSGLKLGPGHRIKTVTASIQAADQWGTPRYVVLERFDV